MRAAAYLLGLVLLAACGGKTGPEIGSIGGGASGGQAGGGQAGGGQAGTAQGGSAGQAGKGGSTQAGSGGSAGGSSGQAGAGGCQGPGCATGCCKTDDECGDFAYVNCVNGQCKMPMPDRCWDSDECASDEVCVGASVCPCGSLCEDADQPGVCAKAWEKCQAPGDCVLQTAGCCASCNTPTPKDVDGVNHAQTAAHQQDVCPGGPVACGPCPNPVPPNADLAAFCEQQACLVVEVSKHEISSCTKDEQCVVRRAACCDCGTPSVSEIIALRADAQGAYEAQVCGPGKGGCAADCAGSPPEGVVAYCDKQKGHCAFALTQQ